MASNILQFEPTRLITAINIVDDMLFYSDGVTEPKKINIKKFRGDDTTGEFANVKVDHSSGVTHIYGRPFQERDITVIKGKGKLKNNIETVVIPKPTDITRDDVNETDIPTKPIEILDESNKPVDSPSEGVTVADIELNTLDRIKLHATYKYGGGRMRDAGFVYSQTVESKDELIKGITETVPGVTKVQAGINNNGDGTAYATAFIDKTDTGSPYYDASIVAGPLYFISYGQLYSQIKNGKYFNSEVIDTIVVDPAASTSAPSGLVTIGEKNIGGGLYEFCAKYDTNGGSPITGAGFLVSYGAINENDPAPTVQELLDSGHNIQAEHRISEGEIYIKEAPVPGKTYYYVPYIENKNGRIYGDGLTTSSTAIKKYREPGVAEPKISTKTVKQNSLVPGDTNFSNANSKLVLEMSFDGNKENREQLHPNLEVNEAGFYFSKNETTAVADLTNKTFSGGSNVSTDGKVFKVPITGCDFENGGLHTLDIRQYVTVEPEESLAYVAYIKTTDGNETTGELVSFTNPPIATKPVFTIINSNWDLKPNTINSNGTSPINVNYNIDVTDFPPGKTIKDIGIYVSRPANEDEIESSGNGRWSTVSEVINVNNVESHSVDNSGLTFTANGGHASIGRYTTTAPIEVRAMTSEEYKYLSKNNIKPLNEDWAAVAYIVDSDGNTHYSPVFNIDSDRSNIDSDLPKPIFGAPQVKTIQHKSPKDTTVTLVGSLPNTGKDVSEIGFYVSTVQPPALSTIDSEIPENLNDGRNPHLDAWISGATKFPSTTSTTTANNHLNQAVGSTIVPNLEFESTATGLTPNTKYYYVAYVKPVQTSNSDNDVSTNNGETLNSIINANHYGSIGIFTTTRTTPSVATAPLVQLRNAEGYAIVNGVQRNLTPTSHKVMHSVNPRSNDNLIVAAGVYFKAAVHFAYPISNQSQNAATMASATNRLQFTNGLEHFVLDPKKGHVTYRSAVEASPIDQIDYFAAAFVDVELSNGSTQKFISDLVSIPNSLNANQSIPELAFFKTGPVDYTKFELNPFVEQSVRQDKNRVGATFKFEGSSFQARSAPPQIDQHGFLLLHPPNTKPTSVSNFVTTHTAGGSNVSSIIANGQPAMTSNGHQGHFSAHIPFFENFPNQYVGNTYYILPFIRYKETQEYKYGDKVEELFIHDPRLANGVGRYPGTAFLSVSEIYWHKTRAEAVTMTVRDGIRLETGSTKTLANAGGYKPPTGTGWDAGAFIDSTVQSSVDWYPFYWTNDKGIQYTTGWTYGLENLGYIKGTWLNTPHYGGYGTNMEAIRIGNKMRVFAPTHGRSRTNSDRRGVIYTAGNNSKGYEYVIYIVPELARNDIQQYYQGLVQQAGSRRYVNEGYSSLGQAGLEQIALAKIIVGYKTFQDIPPGMR